MKNIIVITFLVILFLGCNSEEETTNIVLNLYNDFDKDLYIYLNDWNISIDTNIRDRDINDFTLSRNLIVNKLINSKSKVEFNNQFPHPINTTVSLSGKEPVFLEFNKFDSISLNIKISNKLNNRPLYIQLISFVQKDIIKSDIEHLLFCKKNLEIDLTESIKPFESFKMLDSVKKIGFYDSLRIVPIELKRFNNKLTKLSNND